MLFTHSWLKRLLDTNATPQEIAITLDKIGFEVESQEDKKRKYDNFIIAKIIAANPHPQADNLQVCEVTTGEGDNLQVVCGAKNARAALTVVLAKIGAIVPAGNFEIKKSKIRGVESHGMLCSSEELALEGDASGILELPAQARLGQPFAEYLGLDEVLTDISITPNRGDATSMLGIARDLAATGIGKLKSYQSSPLDIKETEDLFRVEDKKNVHEFLVVKISDIENATGVKEQEIAATMRILGSSFKHALVDISNYAMLTYGRPNHIYDADKIEGVITIRLSQEGEEFKALNGETYIMPAGLTVIADTRKILAVAGVIGGEESKVDDSTRNILVEVGNFSDECVVQAGRALNIHTDSRYRFERKIDPLSTFVFRDILVGIIIRNVGGHVKAQQHIKGTFYDDITAQRIINYTPRDFAKLTGFAIEGQEIDKCLDNLGFLKVADHQYQVPSYRLHDVFRSPDLTEEVLRIIGTERIEAKPYTIVPSVQVNLQDRLEGIRVTLAARGYNEQITWSFNRGNDKAQPIAIANPISEEMVYMRTSLLDNLLEILASNLNREHKSYAFFEIGKIYNRNTTNDKKGLAHEEIMLGAIRSGNMTEKRVHKDDRPLDVFDIKGELFSIIELLGLDANRLSVSAAHDEAFHPNFSAKLLLGKNEVAVFGKLHPTLLKQCEIQEDNVYYFALNLSLLPIKLKDKFSVFIPPALQPINRDLVFVVDKQFKALDLVNFIKGIDKNLLSNVEVFDDFTKDDQRSVGVSLRIQPRDKSLDLIEIEQLVEKVIEGVQTKFGFKLKH